MFVKIKTCISSKFLPYSLVSLCLYLCVVISASFLSTESLAENNKASCWISQPDLNFGTVSTAGGRSNTSVKVTCNHYGHTKTVNLTMCLYIPEGDPSLANNRRRISSNTGSGNASSYLSYDLFYDPALTQRIDTTANPSSLRCVNQTLSPSENQKDTFIMLYGSIYPGQNVLATRYTSFNMPLKLLSNSSEDKVLSAQDVIAQNKTATNNLLVTANYENSCYLQSVPDLNFGQTDNLLQEKTSSTTIYLSCPTNTTWKVSLDNGLNYDGTNKRMRKGTDYIAYALYRDASLSQIWDAKSIAQDVGNNGTQQIKIYGKIPIQNKTVPAGDYLDTVTVTLTY